MDPQSVGINVQSSKSATTPRRLTLVDVQGNDLKIIFKFLARYDGLFIQIVSQSKYNGQKLHPIMSKKHENFKLENKIVNLCFFSTSNQPRKEGSCLI